MKLSEIRQQIKATEKEIAANQNKLALLRDELLKDRMLPKPGTVWTEIESLTAFQVKGWGFDQNGEQIVILYTREFAKGNEPGYWCTRTTQKFFERFSEVK